MNTSACDIGCDVYGYPIRLSAHDADMQNANEPDFEALYLAAIALRQPLSASWHHLACITAPPPRTMPARALFCQRMAIGVRG